MRLRYPLYLKILAWSFLNLALLGVAGYVLFAVQLKLRLDSLLAGRAGERLQAVSEVMSDEFREHPRGDWDEILERFSEAYDVKIFVFRENGGMLAGDSMEFPAELKDAIQAKGNPPGGRLTPRRRPGQAFGMGPPLGTDNLPEEDTGAVKAADPLFLIRAGEPARYWAGIRAEVRSQNLRPPHSGIIVVMADSLLKGGLFFDIKPWVFSGLGVIAFCILFWFPFIRGITRSIRQMTAATEEIAEGRFESHVNTRREDELGRLGLAINRMASRLNGFVTGQKRFIGDIAHELCSPIARIQMALGVLEQESSPDRKERIDDLREEVDQMSEMVNELLSFSRSSLRPAEAELQPAPLQALIEDVIKREVDADAPVTNRVAESITVVADTRMLSRAMANLIRNAVRYAGDDGPITISAVAEGGQAAILVADQGPGVPEEALPTIFDPFYRPESSRSRESGGVGLGLAIVKSCVEACQGTVTCRNRDPRGFEVELRLAAAKDAAVEEAATTA